MQELSRLDAMFYGMEAAGSVGHTGILGVFTPNAGSRAVGATELREHVAPRLPRLSALNSRVVDDPSSATGLRWAEAEADLAHHVREHRLEGEADPADLGRFAARLNDERLDRSRPLWELHVIDGLADGRFAVLFKVHHATGDGAVMVHMVETLFGESAELRSTEAPPEPVARSGAAEDAPSPVAPLTRFNQPLSVERDFAFGQVAVARVQAIRSVGGVTFNDVLLAIWAGALRAWLSLRGELPDRPLVARVPMSLRPVDATAEQGNRLTILRVPLPTHLRDLDEQLQAVRRATEEAKHRGARDPAAGGAVNLAVSSFFGARPPLGWAGAELRSLHSMTVLSATGLSIACSTRGEVVDLGIHVDPRQVENPWTMLRAFEAALDNAEIVLHA